MFQFSLLLSFAMSSQVAAWNRGDVPPAAETAPADGLRLQLAELDTLMLQATAAEPVFTASDRCVTDPCGRTVHLTARSPLLLPLGLAWLLLDVAARSAPQRRVEALEAQPALVQLTLERSRHSGSGAPARPLPRFIVARF